MTQYNMYTYIYIISQPEICSYLATIHVTYLDNLSYISGRFVSCTDTLVMLVFGIIGLQLCSKWRAMAWYGMGEHVSPLYYKKNPFSWVMGEAKGRGGIVHPVYTRCTSFSFHVSWTNHSWDMANIVWKIYPKFWKKNAKFPTEFRQDLTRK